MISIGMIYQYDNTEGSGAIMFSDGFTKEFSTKDWVDANNSPSLGQKVSYIYKANRIEVKLVDAEEEISASPEEPKVSQEESQEEDAPQFKDIDDCIEQFTAMGYKLAKDTQSGATRTLSFRYYSSATGDFGEAVVSQNAGKITVSQTLNGQPI